MAAAIGCALAGRRWRDADERPQALERIRTLYDRGAIRYGRAMDVLDWLIFDRSRRWVGERARGEVREVAAGDGRNFPYYRRETRLTALDLSSVMLGVARGRAEAIGRRVDLTVGDAQALDFPDASFDTVVCTLGLCTIPDERRAVQEAWRVLRPGGTLLLVDHVRSNRWAVRLGQRLLDPLARLLVSDHLLRRPLPIVEEVGFEVVESERRALGIIERLAARRPLR